MTWKVQEVTRGDLESALYWVNDYFGGNIQFIDLREVDENEFSFQIRVIDIDGPGHMIANPINRLRIPTACYHVKTAFYLELPDEALLNPGKHWIARTDNYFPPWQVRGLYDVTDLCECEEKRRSYNPRRRKKPLFPRIKGLKGR